MPTTIFNLVNTYLPPTSSPAAQGVDPLAIRALADALDANGIRPLALTVIRHGHVIASTVWAPYRASDCLQKYSLSKLFAATAIGLAVKEELVSLDHPVATYFPEITGLGPRSRAMTVRNLLSMASGHTADTINEIDPADPIGSFLRMEPDQEPGSVFCYNQGCTLTLSAIVQKVSGQPLHQYLRPRLFEPLGIGEISWLKLGPYDMGFSGLHIPVEAIARLGLMLLQGGVYGGQRILPQAWTDDAMSVHISNGAGNNDWSLGYGYQMWKSQHGWRGDGAFGQLCLVLREQDLVVAVCAETEDMQLEIDLVWEHLLPGLSDSPLAGHDAEDLGTFLEALTLPILSSSAITSPGRHELAAIGPAASMVAATGRVVLDADGITLDDGTGAVTVPCGDGCWLRTATGEGEHMTEVAGTGGWTAPGVFRVQLVPLHSPHALDVTIEIEKGTALLEWRLQPLGNVSLSRRGF